MILNFNKMSPIIKILLLTLSQIFGDQTKRNKTYSSMNSASVSLIFHHGKITRMCYFLSIFFLKREETIGGRKPLVRFRNAMATKIDHFSEITRSKTAYIAKLFT